MLFLFFFSLFAGASLFLGGLQLFAHVLGPLLPLVCGLLALGLDELLAAQQLDKGLLAAIAAAHAGTNDPQVSSLAVTEAWRDGIKQTRDGLPRHQVGASQ